LIDDGGGGGGGAKERRERRVGHVLLENFNLELGRRALQCMFRLTVRVRVSSRRRRRHWMLFFR